MINKIKNINCFRIAKSFILIAVVLLLSNCKEEIPEVGSIEDLTPPTANFTFSQFSPSNYLEVTFGNTSTSATDYLWDFGDGNFSTEFEPLYSYAAEGTYTIKLTASDKLGVTSTATQTLVLTKPTAFIPPIKESGFEDADLMDSLGNISGDGRDSWRNNDLGGVIQITGSPVQEGSQAAKLTGTPSDKRIGYQLLTVTENTVYDVSFYYTMLASPAGFLTVSILDGPVTSHAQALISSLGSVTVSDQTDPSTYIQETITFNSGSNTEVVIYFFNDGSVETRLDNFSIDLSAGTVPPAASFVYAEDSTNYQKINFTNTTINATSYSWDFGDGNTSFVESPSHTFTGDGMYTVTLTALNDMGQIDVYTETIDIAAARPTASFTFAADPSNYKKIDFTNTSIDAVSYAWNFGDGASSTAPSPSHTYSADGKYQVTLTATSGSATTDVYTDSVEITSVFSASINNPSFDDEAVRDDNRIAWRNQALETDADVVFGSSDYLLQTTNTPRTGLWAGKLPTAENSSKPRRWLYQAITVEPNTNYVIKGWIRNNTAAAGTTVTYEIYDGAFSSAATIGNNGNIIASADFDATTGHDSNVYTEATISFNSGNRTEIVLFVTNDFANTAAGSEIYLDDFSIVKM